MFYIIMSLVAIFTTWIGYELYRAPEMEDENNTFNIEDPTTTCWDDDTNHTEGDFH